MTTTATTTPMPPPSLAKFLALVPNPATMSVCEELIDAQKFKAQVVSFMAAFMTETGTPGNWFKDFICSINCPTTTTTTTLP